MDKNLRNGMHSWASSCHMGTAAFTQVIDSWVYGKGDTKIESELWRERERERDQKRAISRARKGTVEDEVG